MVVTTPPFSMARTYIAQLMEYGRQFIIISNMNSITYKEILVLSPIHGKVVTNNICCGILLVQIDFLEWRKTGWRVESNIKSFILL